MASYRQKAAELSTALAEIEDAIEVLEPRERTLIRLHYAQGLTWEEVCVAMNYSWRQIHRIHAKALALLEETAEKSA
jgi:RNA polymerase sigma factor (sigma-70 family)